MTRGDGDGGGGDGKGDGGGGGGEVSTGGGGGGGGGEVSTGGSSSTWTSRSRGDSSTAAFASSAARSRLSIISFTSASTRTSNSRFTISSLVRASLAAPAIGSPLKSAPLVGFNRYKSTRNSATSAPQRDPLRQHPNRATPSRRPKRHLRIPRAHFFDPSSRAILVPSSNAKSTAASLARSVPAHSVRAVSSRILSVLTSITPCFAPIDTHTAVAPSVYSVELSAPRINRDRFLVRYRRVDAESNRIESSFSRALASRALASRRRPRAFATRVAVARVGLALRARASRCRATARRDAADDDDDARARDDGAARAREDDRPRDDARWDDAVRRDARARRARRRGVAKTRAGARVRRGRRAADRRARRRGARDVQRGLDKPIEDGPRAIATTLAAKAALADVLAQNDLFRDTCEAPVFACDLSQLNVKTSSRVSGPLRRSLPTLSEMYGADPYAVDSVLQNVSTLEAIFKANNARVKVDFKGGPEMIGLINQGLEELYNDLPADALAAGRAVFEACDLAVDATAEGDLECRIARAVSQNKRPSGGQS